MLKGLTPGIYITKEVKEIGGSKAYVFVKKRGSKEYAFFVSQVPINVNNGSNCIELIIDSDTDVKYTSDENLYYDTSDVEGYVKVLSREKNEFLSNLRKVGDVYQTLMLGITKVWYDAEMDDRKYIILNNVIIYLDSINKL